MCNKKKTQRKHSILILPNTEIHFYSLYFIFFEMLISVLDLSIIFLPYPKITLSSIEQDGKYKYLNADFFFLSVYVEVIFLTYKIFPRLVKDILQFSECKIIKELSFLDIIQKYGARNFCIHLIFIETYSPYSFKIVQTFGIGR